MCSVIFFYFLLICVLFTIFFYGLILRFWIRDDTSYNPVRVYESNIIIIPSTVHHHRNITIWS